METQRFELIPLDAIRPNPKNPRTSFEGPDFESLTASIKEKGVLQPVLVRSIDGNGTYELVAGERRYRASREAGLDTIPAIVRDMDDEAAFDAMTIENLQREDISELEEARSFQAWLKHKSYTDGIIADLAKRIGVTPQYIRRRVRLLALPELVLAAWEKGQLTYSHLEELCKVSDAKRIEELANDIIRYEYSTKRLRIAIDGFLIDLKKAYFDTKQCKKCAANSLVQKELFGFDAGGKKGRCTDPACFKKEQNNWLLANWDMTDMAKKIGATGFRFQGTVGYNAYVDLYSPFKECKGCTNFVTFLNEDGSQSYPPKACLDKQCYHTLSTKDTKKNQETGQNVTRHEWHGREFRERFYRERVPELMANKEIIDGKSLRVAIAGLVEHCNMACNYFRQLYAPEANNYQFYTRHAWPILEGIGAQDLEPLLLKMSSLALVDWGGDQQVRDQVAVHMGIDLARDWRITKDYLNAKTIAEIIEIGTEVGVFADPIAKEYLGKVLGRKSVEACKKKELLSLFLESGVDLAGKVPKEILDLGEHHEAPLPCGEPGNFCEYCGKDLGDEDECAECAAAGKSDILFCLECGSKLDDVMDTCPNCDANYN